MSAPVDDRIDDLRTAISGIDGEIVELVARRITLSREVGALRMAAAVPGSRCPASRSS
jgi:chorismate mutase